MYSIVTTTTGWCFIGFLMVYTGRASCQSWLDCIEGQDAGGNDSGHFFYTAEVYLDEVLNLIFVQRKERRKLYGILA